MGVIYIMVVGSDGRPTRSGEWFVIKCDYCPDKYTDCCYKEILVAQDHSGGVKTRSKNWYCAQCVIDMAYGTRTATQIQQWSVTTVMPANPMRIFVVMPPLPAALPVCKAAPPPPPGVPPTAAGQMTTGEAGEMPTGEAGQMTTGAAGEMTTGAAGEMPTAAEPLRVDIGGQLTSVEQHDIIVARLEAIEDVNGQTHAQVMILFDQLQNLLSSTPGSSSGTEMLGLLSASQKTQIEAQVERLTETTMEFKESFLQKMQAVEDVSQLVGKLDELKGKVDHDLGELKGKVDHIDGVTLAVADKVDGMSSGFGEVAQKLDGMSSDLSEVKGTIEYIDTGVDSVKSKVKGIETGVMNAVGGINEVLGDISEVKVMVAGSLDEEMGLKGQIETSMLSMQEQIQKLQESFNALTKKMKAASRRPGGAWSSSSLSDVEPAEGTALSASSSLCVEPAEGSSSSLCVVEPAEGTAVCAAGWEHLQ